MKAGYEIVNLGHDGEEVSLVIVYNWHGANKVDNVRWMDNKDFVGKESVVALFRIKPKAKG